MRFFFAALLTASAALAGDTTVLFQTGSANATPYPTDTLTTPDSQQKTGLRVNLSYPAACLTNPSLGTCVNTALINQFDGFNPNARVKVCFSAPIDKSTIAGGVFFYPVSGGAPTPVNQIIFDPTTNCVNAKPDVILDQHAKYLLVVTDSVQDVDGHKVKQSDDFKTCVKHGGNAYCQSLAAAINDIDVPGKIVGGSLFTTMSTSDWLEKARTAVNAPMTPDVVIPAGYPWVFPTASISKFTWVPDAAPIGPQDIPLAALSGVENVAFGLYLAPNFLQTSGPAAGSIGTTPTAQAITAPNAYVPVSFHVFLPPASTMPAGGFPVVIYGHGMGDNQFGAPTFMASTLAKMGFATVAVEVNGHGFGPNGKVQITNTQNITSTVATPGRGILLPGSPYIGPTDGCILPGPLAIRDCTRQTAVDLMAFTRTLADYGGFGLGLNAGRVYFVGQSLGSLYGTLLHATEPRVRAAVINAGGGTEADVARLAITARPLGEGFLAFTNPGLFNVPPAASQTYFHDHFNDNYAYRGAAMTNTVPGAINIQDAFEQAEWIGMPGDALAFGPMLQSKPTAFQFGIGDLEVPNPTESSLVRAARGQSSTWLLRFDIASGYDQRLPAVMMPGCALSDPAASGAE